jgi:peptide/nickel transport system permease protein
VVRVAGWRLLALVPTMIVVTFLAFVLLAMNPVDPAEELLGPVASADQIAAKRDELGLDRPIVVRYAEWLGNAVTGDLGSSMYTSTPVTTMIGDRIGVTLSITLGGLAFAVAVGCSAGIWSALRAGRAADRIAMAATAIGQAIPAFWLGTLLVAAFAVHWPLFDAVFYTSPSDSVTGWLRSITLPCVAIGATGAAWIARHTRTEFVAVLQQEYIRTALAKGASRRQVVLGHAMRNAAPPLLTLVVILFSALLSASFVIERVFVLPGLGSLALESIRRNDPAPLLGFVTCTVFVVVVADLAVDLAHSWLNPKVRAA